MRVPFRPIHFWHRNELRYHFTIVDMIWYKLLFNIRKFSVSFSPSNQKDAKMSSSTKVSWQQRKVWPPCCRAHSSSYFADKHGVTWFLSFAYSPAFGTERLSIYLRLLRSFVLDSWQMVSCSHSCGLFDMAYKRWASCMPRRRRTHLPWFFVCFVLIILVNVEGYAMYCSVFWRSRKSKLYTTQTYGESMG